MEFCERLTQTGDWGGGSFVFFWPLSYRVAGAPAVLTRSHLFGEGWRTGPSPGWLWQPAGGAPWARCSTGSTPPMPAPRWWAARRTSAPLPETVPAARPGPAPLRAPWGRLPVGPRPRHFCWWIWPYLRYNGAHPSVRTRRSHWCAPRPLLGPVSGPLFDVCRSPSTAAAPRYHYTVKHTRMRSILPVHWFENKTIQTEIVMIMMITSFLSK